MLTLAACGSSPAPAPSPPAAPGTAAASADMPGSIGVNCKARAPGYKDYTTSTLATNLDVCSVGGDGMLTLAVKGEGANGVSLHLGGYHGAGSYPLTGASVLTLTNSTPTGGSTQSTEHCAASQCSVEVKDGSAGAAAEAPHELSFAVSCPVLCDSDTHVCSTSPGPATWTFTGGCKVM